MVLVGVVLVEVAEDQLVEGRLSRFQAWPGRRPATYADQRGGPPGDLAGADEPPLPAAIPGGVVRERCGAGGHGGGPSGRAGDHPVGVAQLVDVPGEADPPAGQDDEVVAD